MKEVKEMPKDQQFVAIWEYNGKIWAGTVCWIEEDDCFMCWDDDLECWSDFFTLSDEVISTVKYFIKGE